MEMVFQGKWQRTDFPDLIFTVTPENVDREKKSFFMFKNCNVVTNNTTMLNAPLKAKSQ